MFRTLLVLAFLAACGVYFHHSSPETASPATSAPAAKRTVDDSPLQALKKVLPAELFKKDVQPVIEQNRQEGLSSDQLTQLLAKLQSMGKALGGKASEAVDNAVKDIEKSMPGEKDMADRTAKAAGALAKNVGEGVKESLPVVKELTADLLKGAVAVLSQILNAAAELLQK